MKTKGIHSDKYFKLGKAAAQRERRNMTRTPTPSLGPPLSSRALKVLPLVLALQLVGPAEAQSGQLPPNDDGSSGLIPLGFTFRLFGTDYNALFINNNGNLTFSQPLSTFTPFAFPSSSGFPMIAPFFADVDTRNGLGTVTYQGTDGYFTVTWNNVGYYNAFTTDNPDLRNTFSVTLQKNNGIIFQYGSMEWTTGDASGGEHGFGGSAATLGLDQGNGVDAVIFRRYSDGSVSQLNGTIWYFQTDNAQLPIPAFKQCDSTWGSQITLSGTSSMCSTGCFVTCTAMVLNGLGHNTDPGKLNTFLSPFMSGGSLSFNDVPQDRIFFGQTDNVPGPKVRFRHGGFIVIPTPPPLPPDGDTGLRDQIVGQLGSAIDQFGPVILRIPSRNWGTHGYLSTHTHAGVATGVTTSDVAIQEPGWAASPGTLTAYADFVNHHVAANLTPPHPEWQLTNADGHGNGHDLSWLAGSTFTYPEKLTPFSKQIIQGQANSPVEFVVTDPRGRKLGHDMIAGVRYNEIPGSAYFRDLEVAPADDAPLVTTEAFGPLVFELGDFVEGRYQFEVFGLATGPWSLQFGVSDPILGFNPMQFRQTGTASEGSYQSFTRTVTAFGSPDETPPEASCTVSRELLWPPNHSLVDVEVVLTAEDDTTASGNLVLAGARLSSNEADQGGGSGDRRGDCNGSDGYTAPVDVSGAFAGGGIASDGRQRFVGHLTLRAERAGTGQGRIYTLELQVADEAGNLGSVSCVVVVHHDRGVDLNDPAGTFLRVGESEPLKRVFQVNHRAKYGPRR